MDREAEALRFGRLCLAEACVALLTGLGTFAVRLALYMPLASHWALFVLLLTAWFGVLMLIVYTLRLPSDRRERRWADGSPMDR